MAGGDRQLAFTTGPVPTSVQVSGPDRITPKTVNASFDGTGAAGAFLPCLIITGSTGREVARIPAPQVAAGASAEVSWFPRVGGSSGGLIVDTEIAQQGGFVIAPGDGTGNHPSLPWAHDSGAFLLDYTTPETPAVLADGVYAVAVQVIMSTPVFNHASVMTAKLRVGSSAALAAMSVLDTRVSGSGLGVATPEIPLTMPPVFMAAGETLEVGVRQGSGVNLAFQFQQPAGAFITRLA